VLNSLNVLIVSERPDHLRSLVRTLDASSARISACFTVRHAREIFSQQPVDLVFSDERLSDGSYRELLRSGRFGQQAASFVLLLHTGEWEEYLDAMRLGALDVLRCPLQPAEVEATVQRAIAIKERSNAARLAIEAARASDGEPAQKDHLFEELLGLAAASLGSTRPNSSTSATSSSAAPKSGTQRPKVMRRGVA
jgi:DNA-binding NtrC family response regulator